MRKEGSTPNNVLIVRSRIGYWVSVVIALFALYLLFDQMYHHGPLSAVHYAFVPVLLIAVTFSIWFIPVLVVYDHGIQVTNPLFRFQMTWDEVQEIYNKWGVRIRTKHHDFPVWVLPPSRKMGANINPSSTKRQGVPKATVLNILLARNKDIHLARHESALKRVGVVTLDSMSGAKELRDRKSVYDADTMKQYAKHTPELPYYRKLNYYSLILWGLCVVLFIVQFGL